MAVLVGAMSLSYDDSIKREGAAAAAPSPLTYTDRPSFTSFVFSLRRSPSLDAGTFGATNAASGISLSASFA